ncbi:hypothetical protein E1281_37895 [Actinomadura sp. KC345]|uniref:hypothetical protein n=1 Tax=Actinomadura sp. KC345 TaxID=2530371 RepID=UPI001046E59C|nr:hypothetical protein [Actinomadura sp. KC345]TDC40929.1 hypothetical protein E1281_37895 [Actinomadura sp. KC345]
MLDVTISWTVDLLHHVAYLAPVPNPGGGEQPPGEVSSKVETLLKWGVWGALTCCVAGFVIIGARMGINHKRGEGGAHMGSLGIVGFAIVLIVSANALVKGLA